MLYVLGVPTMMEHNNLHKLAEFLRLHGDFLVNSADSGGGRASRTTTPTSSALDSAATAEARAPPTNCKLCLTTRCLAQLTQQFNLLPQNERSGFEALGDADSTQMRDILFIHDVIQKVTKLKIVTSPATVEGEITLSRFRALKQLELQRVPPHLITVLPAALAEQLEAFEAHRCLTGTKGLLKLLGNASWTRLETLRLSHNALISFDPDYRPGQRASRRGGKPLCQSQEIGNGWDEYPDYQQLPKQQKAPAEMLSSSSSGEVPHAKDHPRSDMTRLIPRLRNLDLSHNQIEELDLSGFEWLTCVDVSFNLIAKIPKLDRRSSLLHLAYLCLRNNLLEDLQGLEALTALKVLDLGNNMMSDFAVLEPLANILQLDRLTLEGNPLSFHKNYRNEVAKYIAKTVILDNRFDVHSGRTLTVSVAPLRGLDAADMATDRQGDQQEIAIDEVEGRAPSFTTIGSVSSGRQGRPRQCVIGDPVQRAAEHEKVAFQGSSFLQAANLKLAAEEHRRTAGDAWLVVAAHDLRLPTAQSTPLPKLTPAAACPRAPPPSPQRNGECVGDRPAPTTAGDRQDGVVADVVAGGPGGGDDGGGGDVKTSLKKSSDQQATVKTSANPDIEVGSNNNNNNGNSSNNNNCRNNNNNNNKNGSSQNALCNRTHEIDNSVEENPERRKESRQSDGIQVISHGDNTPCFDELAAALEHQGEISEQPREPSPSVALGRAVDADLINITNAQGDARGETGGSTPSRRQQSSDKQFGTPVVSVHNESDKEESPAIGIIDAEPPELNDDELDEVYGGTDAGDGTSEGTFLSAQATPPGDSTEADLQSTTIATLQNQSSQVTTEPPTIIQTDPSLTRSLTSVAESDRLEEDSAVWARLRELRARSAVYDAEHTIPAESKVHLEMMIFKENENFKAAFKAHIVLQGGDYSFQGYVVISDHRLYATKEQVIGREGDVLWSTPLDQLQRITVQLGGQAVLIETREKASEGIWSMPGRPGSPLKWILAYIGDAGWCDQFTQILNGCTAESVRNIRSEVAYSDVLASLHMENDPLRVYSQGYWCILDDGGVVPVEKTYASIVITSQDIVVVRERHVEPEKVKFTEVCAHSITAVSSLALEEDDPRIANVTFALDETANREQVWYFETASFASMYAFIEGLRQPWQDIFDVELPLSYI